jgi:hypothetical protein
MDSKIPWIKAVAYTILFVPGLYLAGILVQLYVSFIIRITMLLLNNTVIPKYILLILFLFFVISASLLLAFAKSREFGGKLKIPNNYIATINNHRLIIVFFSFFLLINIFFLIAYFYLEESVGFRSHSVTEKDALNSRIVLISRYKA